MRFDPSSVVINYFEFWCAGCYRSNHLCQIFSQSVLRFQHRFSCSLLQQCKYHATFDFWTSWYRRHQSIDEYRAKNKKKTIIYLLSFFCAILVSWPISTSIPVFIFIFYFQLTTHLSYSFIYTERMKGWVGWSVVDSLPTTVVTHQLQVERSRANARQPEIDVLPLCHATNLIVTRTGRMSSLSLIWRVWVMLR